MATLVLTAVGTALGGPIGGALGAMLGQSVDAALFAPKARLGPRLSDLKVQTSSYGDAVPLLFGTMRVAGTVIWATDLIERRQTRSAGKGRPKQIEFSYSASFAVAVSARPIGAVRRIWADGKILRDANGRFAEAVRFRSYTGGPDQAVDPLIASAVGIDRASAFRGIAYALFEALDLAAFGNRIPQLSFEVEADAAPMTAAQIGGALLTGAAATGGPMLAGFAASGGRVRDALAPLAAFADLGMQLSGVRTVLAGPHWASDAGANAQAARVHSAAPLQVDEDRRTPLARVPGQVMLRHFDPARDYQTSQQTGAVAGGGGPTRAIELPGALAADAAQGQVRVLARAASDARRGVMVRAGLGALSLPLGQAMTFILADMADGLWRIAERRVGADGVVLMLVRHAVPLAAVAAVGDGGSALIAGDLPGLAATLVVFDAPGDGEAPRAAPLRLVAAAGSDPGWRGADLWWVAAPESEPEPIGRISAAAALGVIDQPLAPPATWLIDWARPIAVTLVNAGMTLAHVTEAALVAGANLAMVGGEAIQFMRAVPLGPRRWRLEGILRGRGGAEPGPGGQAAGAPFVLLGDAALVSLPDAMAWQASSTPTAIDWQPRGDDTMQRITVAAGQRALNPLTPVHGRAQHVASGEIRIDWIPCSRAGARWRDGVEVPLGENAAGWRIEWIRPDGGAAALEVAEPTASLAAASFAPGAPLTITQRGDFGLSAPLTILMP